MTHLTEPTKPKIFPQVARGAMQVAGGVIPFAGGFLSAIASAWSEKEQERVNSFFSQWMRMLEDEIREKERTVIEIMARIDIQDEAIAKRIESSEFQKLVKKSFRDWACVESEEKRIFIRNILSNAASTAMASDDVVRLFLEWISLYSELHFKVIGAIYNTHGISRGQIWKKIGRERTREDSADADLYKLLIRDLSTGGIIRQHRDVDYHGAFVAKSTTTKKTQHGGNKTLTSAFDEVDLYELTELGKQFVHYAMNELVSRITYEAD